MNTDVIVVLNVVAGSSRTDKRLCKAQDVACIYQRLCKFSECYYSAQVGEWSIAISLSACLSVCPRACLWNRYTNLHWMCCADPLAALRYIVYFWLYGWSHVWP